MSDDQADILEQLNRAASDQEAEKVREGEYIPAGEGEGQDAPAVSTADVLEKLLGPLLRLVPALRDISAEEIQLMAQANGEALDAWFPEGILNGKWGALVAALMVNYAILEPRLKPRPPEDSPPAGPDA